MRTVVVGAKGQLGRDLLRVFGGSHEVWGYDLPELDIADSAQVRWIVETHAPDVVINAAAYTDVERAEDESSSVFRVNAEGAGVVADAAAAAGAAAVYYSTDYVFGGTQQRPYEPEDPVAPIGVYARSKRAGEEATMAACANHFIVRTAWLYGVGGNNFVEKILRAAASRPKLRVVADEVGSPTFTRDLADATRVLCEGRAYGVYHAVNEGSCSRYEFAQAILELAGMATPIAPCASTEFPTKAERPLYSVLSNERLRAATGHAMRAWRDALEEYMTLRA